MFVCSLLSPWKKKSSFFFSPLVFPRFFSFSLKISLLSLPSFFSFSYVEDATDLFHGRTLWILIVPLLDRESFGGWLFPSKRYWNRFFHLINSSICLFAFHHFFLLAFLGNGTKGEGHIPFICDSVGPGGSPRPSDWYGFHMLNPIGWSGMWSTWTTVWILPVGIYCIIRGNL